MNHLSEQYQQYHHLLGLRKKYIFSNLICFFAGVIFLDSWGLLLWVVYAYISTFLFLAKDICPFCKQSFFRVGFGINLLSCQCINCKMPHNKNSHDETAH